MKKITNKELLILVMLVIVVFSFVFLIVTKPVISLEYNNKKIEDSVSIPFNEEVKIIVKSSFLNKDISDSVSAEGKVDNTKIGNYKVTYHLKYLFYNIDRTILVNIVDEESPVISLVGNLNPVSCSVQSYEEEGFIATDNYDGDITSKVDKKINDNEIIYFVSDSSNNKVEVKRVVDTHDTEPPSLKLKGSERIYIKKGDEYKDEGVDISDNCDKEFSKYEIDNNVNTSVIGEYDYTYTIYDSSDNSSKITRRVYVYNPDTIQNMGGGEKGVIYLTFDDGPSNYTDSILDILNKYGIKATFFVTNSGKDSLIKREYDEGHTVALHTASHNYKTVYTSVEGYFNDLESVQNRVSRITGEKSMIIRFPGGSSNTVSRNYKDGIMTELTDEVLNRGYHYFDWNVSVEDAGTCAKKDSFNEKRECIYSYFKKGLSKSRSNVVLMHDVKEYTALELENMIQYAIGEGYKFDKITMNTTQVHHGVKN